MADKTAIEWTDASWNPIRARNKATGKVGWFCTHASEGCRNCYAESFNARLGTGIPYRAQDSDEVELFVDEKILGDPLRWKRPRKIFTLSMSDLFGEFIPDEMIDRVFAVMALCPQHTFQVLTKRPERMREYLRDARGNIWDALRRVPGPRRNLVVNQGGNMVVKTAPDWPLPNVWLGVSVEDQKHADERIPPLLVTPAAKRFISAEPLLGPIDLTNLDHLGTLRRDHIHGISAISPYNRTLRGVLDWVIVGGESGRDARPMHPEWVCDLRDQCQAASVPFFFKQWGEWTPDVTYHIPVPIERLRHVRDDGFVATAQEADDIEARQGHQNWKQIARVGKKAAGRLLDGREWSEFPH